MFMYQPGVQSDAAMIQSVLNSVLPTDIQQAALTPGPLHGTASVLLCRARLRTVKRQRREQTPFGVLLHSLPRELVHKEVGEFLKFWHASVLAEDRENEQDS